MPNVLSSKAKAWMDRKGIAWPWKNNENGGSFDGRTGRFVWPWLHNSQEDELGSIDSLKVDRQMYETASNTTGDPNSLSSSCDTSSSRSTNNYGQKFDIIAIDNLDVEILWNDLIVREQIGQGKKLRDTIIHFERKSEDGDIGWHNGGVRVEYT
ncbi:hypothetical protein Tco_0027934 [Tanacetum coccineum]